MHAQVREGDRRGVCPPGRLRDVNPVLVRDLLVLLFQPADLAQHTVVLLQPPGLRQARVQVPERGLEPGPLAVEDPGSDRVPGLAVQIHALLVPRGAASRQARTRTWHWTVTVVWSGSAFRHRWSRRTLGAEPGIAVLARANCKIGLRGDPGIHDDGRSLHRPASRGLQLERSGFAHVAG